MEDHRPLSVQHPPKQNRLKSDEGWKQSVAMGVLNLARPGTWRGGDWFRCFMSDTDVDGSQVRAKKPTHLQNQCCMLGCCYGCEQTEDRHLKVRISEKICSNSSLAQDL